MVLFVPSIVVVVVRAQQWYSVLCAVAVDLAADTVALADTILCGALSIVRCRLLHKGSLRRNNLYFGRYCMIDLVRLPEQFFVCELWYCFYVDQTVSAKTHQSTNRQ
jgi:hypothetical protein